MPAEFGLSLRFKVTIDGHTSLGTWTKCSGLSFEYEVDDYREGGNIAYVHHLPRGAKYTNLTLVRPIDSSTADVARWLASVTDRMERSTAEIAVLDSHGDEVASWSFTGVFPVKWTGPSLDIGTNQAARPRPSSCRTTGSRGEVKRCRPRPVSSRRRRSGWSRAMPPRPRSGSCTTRGSSAPRSRRPGTGPTTSGARSSTRPQFAGAGPQTVSMEIMLDAWEDQAADVVAGVQTLLEWLKPTPSSIQRRSPSPPVLAFEWGRSRALADFRGYLKQVTRQVHGLQARRHARSARPARSSSRRYPRTRRARTRPRGPARAAGAGRWPRATRSSRSPGGSTGTPPSGAAWRPSTGSTTRSACRPGRASSCRPRPRRCASPGAGTDAMPDADRSTRPTIEVDGRELDAAVMPDVERTVVDDHLHLPDTFELTIRDHARDVLERTSIRIGSRVKVSAPALGSSTAAGAHHRRGHLGRGGLHLERLQGDRARLRPRPPPRPGTAHRDLPQREVLRRRPHGRLAGRPGGGHDRRLGRGARVRRPGQPDGPRLPARPRPARSGSRSPSSTASSTSGGRPRPARRPGSGDYASTDPTQLVFGQDLLEFRPRVTSAGQVGEVQVRGWSVADKEALVGTAPGGTTTVQLPDTPADLASRFGNPTHVVVDRAFGTQRAVDDAARATADSIGSAIAEATAKARGNPVLKAGKPVSVSLVAAPFAGRYTLTHTRHVFDDEAGYVTELVVSGRQERSLLGLASAAAAGASAAQFAGVVIGIVTDDADPEALGRVKLRFPWLADEFETDWARVVMLGAGPDRGAVFVPEVNDEVLVAFEHGEFRAPFVIGGLWNGQDKPPEHDTSGGLQERSIVSRLGNKVVLIDKDGSAGVRLVTAGGQCEVFLDDGSNEVVIKSGGGKVTIEAQSDVVLKSTGNFTSRASGNVDIKASGNRQPPGVRDRHRQGRAGPAGMRGGRA